jgi:hypothetical protein
MTGNMCGPLSWRVLCSDPDVRYLSKTEYTPAALFLILESMGGTWCMYEKIVMGKKLDPATIKFSPETTRQIKEYNENLPVVLRQILHDLTMWDSIPNTSKKTRYMSRNVQQFIDTYELKNDEPKDSAQDSSDDDAPDDAPPDAPAAAWSAAPSAQPASALQSSPPPPAPPPAGSQSPPSLTTLIFFPPKPTSLLLQ